MSKEQIIFIGKADKKGAIVQDIFGDQTIIRFEETIVGGDIVILVLGMNLVHMHQLQFIH